MNHRQIDDVTLVERARGGDRMAFATLIERHQGRTYAIAVSVCRDRDDARDVVQDAFVLGYQRLDSCREPAAFGAWIARIAVNLAKNQHRTRARRTARDDRYARREPTVTANLDDGVISRQDTAVALHALERLHERDRAILGARFLAGLSESEAANVLGVRPGTVKSRTSRALGRLRTMIEVTGNDR
jgi:RNA polymerase sigma factor (sigma-70 family)